MKNKLLAGLLLLIVLSSATTIAQANNMNQMPTSPLHSSALEQLSNDSSRWFQNNVKLVVQKHTIRGKLMTIPDSALVNLVADSVFCAMYVQPVPIGQRRVTGPTNMNIMQATYNGRPVPTGMLLQNGKLTTPRRSHRKLQTIAARCGQFAENNSPGRAIKSSNGVKFKSTAAQKAAYLSIFRSFYNFK